MKSFIEPKHNPMVLAVAKLLLPAALKSEGLEIRLLAGCRTAFERLKDSNAMIAINHTDRSDPLTVFALSTYVRENFYYLSARELFEQNLGFRGWVMQNCGAYSVIRGEPADAESRQATINMLATPGTPKLVMFPEGDVSGLDRIMPLRLDGMRNILNGQRGLHKTRPGASLYVLPVAAFYQVTADSIGPLKAALCKIESALGIESVDVSDLGSRIELAVRALVRQLEDHYSVGAESVTGDWDRQQARGARESDTTDRLLRLCEVVSAKVREFGYGLESSGGAAGVHDGHSLASQVYTARAGLNRWDTASASNADSYQRRLRDEALQRAHLLTKDLDRVQQLMILSSTMQQNHGNLEFCWRATDRLEHEVLGKVTPKGKRIAWIDAASPLSVQHYLNEFARDEVDAAKRLEIDLRQTMDDQLQSIKHRIAGPTVRKPRQLRVID